MPISLTCPDCKSSLSVPGELAGQWVCCPKCGTFVSAPVPLLAPPDQPAAALAPQPPAPCHQPSFLALSFWRAVWLLGAVVCGVAAFAALVTARADAAPFWVRLAALPIAFVGGAVAYQFVRALRRSFVERTASVAEYDASKPFVVYLRSFNDDEAAAQASAGANVPVLPAAGTEEEAIVAAFKPLGQVIAIGRPGEPMPELGAVRFYVGDHEWQDVVRGWIARAQLVVLRYGTSAGLNWELEQCIRTLRPEQLVVLVPHGAKDGPLPCALARLTGQSVPDLPSPPGIFSAFHHSSFVGYLQFGPGWSITPRPLQLGSFGGWFASLSSLDLWQPMAAPFSVAFRPVYEALGRPWSPPPSTWLRNLLTFGLIVLGIGVVVFVLFSIWEPESIRKSREQNAEFDRRMKKILDDNKKLDLDRKLEESRKGFERLQEQLKRNQFDRKPLPPLPPPPPPPPPPKRD